MVHISRGGGKKCMEVDHFNPHKKKDLIQEYSNLFLAHRHCNGAKRDRWPSGNDRKLGARFLNCCIEIDYDVHILEDPDTHEVVGVTPEGRYHVRNCDLNARHLVDERTERALVWDLIESKAVYGIFGFELPQEVQLLISSAQKMIPKIKYLSGDALQRQRDRRKALAELAQRQ